MTQFNKYSSRVTQPASQGASQAMLYAAGLTDEDMQKPQVGIGSVWYEGNSCNMHLLDLAAKVKEGVTKAGLVGMRFNTIGVSDDLRAGGAAADRHGAARRLPPGASSREDQSDRRVARVTACGQRLVLSKRQCRSRMCTTPRTTAAALAR